MSARTYKKHMPVILLLAMHKCDYEFLKIFCPLIYFGYLIFEVFAILLLKLEVFWDAAMC
jgi:hypothetical protein